jgi:tetratricopeptide (TPR) repeat protein
MQRDLLYSAGTDGAVLAELEDLIVPLDMEPDQNTPQSQRKTALASARAKVSELEKSGIKDGNFEADLAAWSGRLFLLEGRQRDAAAQLKHSETLSHGNLQARILSIRIEGDATKRRDMAEAAITEAAGGGFLGRAGELQIELGRALMDLRQYQEAAAAFDTAFPLLRPVYRETYSGLRNRAWTLRGIDPLMGARTAEIAGKAAINWEEAMELSKAETELLRFITAGRDWPEGELFKMLRDRNIIPPVQDLSVSDPGYQGNPAPKDLVLRAGAAWYLWHLLAENRADKGLLTRYSSRYPNRSPIQDLPRNSIFFDVIIGCVERELMSLPDGRNFKGGEKVGGAEFLMMLKKVK